ncbi:hypothetical protein AB0I60_25120 [Actinosynnema sp. NPDC050436]|uniref:hypothetical protein n=1 Tax=Actinosynnema sp. NPDC050436 TaxID=3155659 RepID=UPI0033EE1D1E
MCHENYTRALGHGPVVTAAGDGRIAGTVRDDLAQAAVIALTAPGHENAVHELTGPRAWGFDEFVALAAILGRPATPVEDAVRSALR